MLSISRSLVSAAQAASRALSESIFLVVVDVRASPTQDLIEAVFVGLDIASLQTAHPLGDFRLPDGTRVVRDISSAHSLSPAWWAFAGMVGRASWASRTLGYASVGALDHVGADRDVHAVAAYAGLDAPLPSGKRPPSAAADPWGLPHSVHPLARNSRAGNVRRVAAGGFGS